MSLHFSNDAIEFLFWIVYFLKSFYSFLKNQPNAYKYKKKVQKTIHLINSFINAQVDRSTSFDMNRVKVALASLGWTEARKMIGGDKKRGFIRPAWPRSIGQVNLPVEIEDWGPDRSTTLPPRKFKKEGG